MIDYEEDWICKLLFIVKGSVSFKACSFAIPACILTVILLLLDDYYPTVRVEYHILDLSSSTIWNATTAALVFMIGFRTNRAIIRFWEGAGLLHQMRGEWFDTVSNCVTFSTKALEDQEEEVHRFRHALVRLMSLAHGSALEEISGNQSEQTIIDFRGLDQECLQQLKVCNDVYNFNKVEVTLHMIQSLIISAYNRGILNVPAPILSRVYQTISRGFVNLLNTKKITDIKFPFPYVQLISLLLLTFSILCPLLISSFVQNKIIACILTFIPVFAMSSVNYISIELENPFGRDDNDLPLFHFQEEMNCCLMMLLHPNADLVPTTSPECKRDFVTLAGMLETRGSKRHSNRPGGAFQRYQTHFINSINIMRSRSSLDGDECSEEPNYARSRSRSVPRSSCVDRFSRSASFERISNYFPSASRDTDTAFRPRRGQDTDSVMKTARAVNIIEEGNELPPTEPVKDHVSHMEPFKSGTLESKQVALPKVSADTPQTINNLHSFGVTGEIAVGIKDEIRSASLLPPITEGLEAIGKSLDTWTKLLETQVNELHLSFTTLRQLAEGLPPVQEKSLVTNNGTLPLGSKPSSRQTRYHKQGRTFPKQIEAEMRIRLAESDDEILSREM